MDLTVALPDDLANFVERRVAIGHAGSADEVVRQALLLLRQQDPTPEPTSIDALRQAWKAGLDSGDGGELDWDRLRSEVQERHHAAR